MAEFPVSPDALTARWLSERLHEPVADLTVMPFAEGAGVIGLVTRASYTSDGEPRSLIAKFPSPAEANRAVARHFDMYGREVMFYQQIAAHLPVRCPLARFAGFDPSSHDFCLLLEDLGDFTTGDQVAGADLDQAQNIVREIARLHASTWGLRDRWLTQVRSHNNPAQVAGMADGFVAGWPVVLEQFPALVPDSARAAAGRLPAAVARLLQTMSASDQCLVHADVRLDNVLFKGAEVALIDWQSVCSSCGEQDLAYFLTQSLPTELFERESASLLRLYHETLCAAGVEGYPFDRCVERYRLAALYLLCYAVVIAGTLDMGNERGARLAAALLGRCFNALDLLDAYELLD